MTAMTSAHPAAATPGPRLVPPVLATWLAVFRPCFTAPVWSRVLIQVVGAVPAPGKHDVTPVPRVMGLAPPSLGQALNPAAAAVMSY
ncbi:MAG TPA: hypothetical protein VND19_01155 [Acetobacteraceae bacterium]|nr:hypothetical protein [Acetobacteraceae bacterium]